ncbi:hypothetical protein V8G69_00830 [Gaetbulibacter sp. M235]|uniref:hypothetical protein n=1 Tax=Gaetbulibacter sp. M235 TaxID=3126510 RepID=UPI00374F1DF2
MKISFSIVLLSFLTLYSFSQNDSIKTNGLFYKLSLATTLTINEDYVAFDDDDESTLIEPNALFVNNTIGYQFDRRSLIGLNFEYNWHSEQGLHFAPAFLSFQYNIYAAEDKIFLRGGYGTLLGLGKSFEKGNMFRLGIGSQSVMSKNNNSVLIGLDFTRKRFGYKTLEGISSVSIFLEFMFF